MEMVNSITVVKAAKTKALKHKRRFCSFVGCQRIVKSQGVCQRHGAKPRTCKIDGCTKQAQGNFNGMCKSHARQYNVMKEKHTCAASNARPAKQASNAVVPGGDVVPTAITIQAETSPKHTHYENSDSVRPNDTTSMVTRTISQPTSPSPLTHNKNRRVCQHEGCTSAIKSHGLCQRHGAVPARCKISGCAKQAQGSFHGMCKAHHQVLVKTGGRTTSTVSCHDVSKSQRGYNPYSSMPYQKHCVSEEDDATTITVRRPSTSSSNSNCSSSSSSSSAYEGHLHHTRSYAWERPYYFQNGTSTRRGEFWADLSPPTYATTPVIGEELLRHRHKTDESYLHRSRDTNWNNNPAPSVTTATVRNTILSNSEFCSPDFSDSHDLDLTDIDHMFDFNEDDLESFTFNLEWFTSL